MVLLILGIVLKRRRAALYAACNNAAYSEVGKYWLRASCSSWRKHLSTIASFKSDSMMAITVGATILTLIPLFLVLGYLIHQGRRPSQWAFFTHMPAPRRREGGGHGQAIVGPQVVGTRACWGVPIGWARAFISRHIAEVSKFPTLGCAFRTC